MPQSVFFISSSRVYALWGSANEDYIQIVSDKHLTGLRRYQKNLFMLFIAAGTENNMYQRCSKIQ